MGREISSIFIDNVNPCESNVMQIFENLSICSDPFKNHTLKISPSNLNKSRVIYRRSVFFFK